jgi:hypothetical protein
MKASHTSTSRPAPLPGAGVLGGRARVVLSSLENQRVPPACVQPEAKPETLMYRSPPHARISTLALPQSLLRLFQNVEDALKTGRPSQLSVSFVAATRDHPGNRVRYTASGREVNTQLCLRNAALISLTTKIWCQAWPICKTQIRPRLASWPSHER